MPVDNYATSAQETDALYRNSDAIVDASSRFCAELLMVRFKVILCLVSAF